MRRDRSQSHQGPELEYTPPEFPYLVPRIPRWDAEAVSDFEERSKRSSPFFALSFVPPSGTSSGTALSYSGFGYPGSKQATLAAQASLVLEAGSVPGLAYANPGASAMNKIAVTRTRALVELTAQRRGRTFTCQSKKM